MPPERLHNSYTGDGATPAPLHKRHITERKKEMQKFTIYHPNAKGTGSALSLTPCIAGLGEGHIILGIAKQTSTGNEVEGKPTFPRFAWDEQIKVRLDPMDIMEIIRVFKGEQEAINDGKGLWCRRNKCALDVRHLIDPVPCYQFTVKNVAENGATATRGISLSYTEGETICIALTYALGPIVFGQ